MKTETTYRDLDRLDPRDPSLGLAETVDRVYVVPGRGFVIRDQGRCHRNRWIAVASLGDLTHAQAHTSERGHARPLSCDAYPVSAGTLRDAVRLMPSGACR